MMRTKQQEQLVERQFDHFCRTVLANKTATLYGSASGYNIMSRLCVFCLQVRSRLPVMCTLQKKLGSVLEIILFSYATRH